MLDSFRGDSPSKLDGAYRMRMSVEDTSAGRCTEAKSEQQGALGVEMLLDKVRGR